MGPDKRQEFVDVAEKLLPNMGDDADSPIVGALTKPIAGADAISTGTGGEGGAGISLSTVAASKEKETPTMPSNGRRLAGGTCHQLAPGVKDFNAWVGRITAAICGSLSQATKVAQ